MFRQEASYQQKTAIVRFNFLLEEVPVRADPFGKLTVQSLFLGMSANYRNPR